MKDIDLNIVRKIRLSKLDCYQIKDDESELFEWIEQNIMGLKNVVLKEYPDYVMFLNKEGRNIFKYDFKNNDFSVRHDLIWSVLKNRFKYDSDQIGILIKNIVQQLYKLNDIDPKSRAGFFANIDYFTNCKRPFSEGFIEQNL